MIDDKVALTQKLLPLAEFFMGSLIAMIEMCFRPEKMHQRTCDFYEYLGLVEQYFEIDTAKLKRILEV